MKILHTCLANYYADNQSYQENLLPKYHQRLGYEVEIIANCITIDNDGHFIYDNGVTRYKNEYGISVTRLQFKKPLFLYRRFRRYVGLYNALEESNPDVIFIHEPQFLDTDVIVKYLKKHPNVILYADNHADLQNSARNWVSRYILHGFVWKMAAKKLLPYIEKYYGVLPARVDFLKDVYNLPDEKCELLVLGADDDLILQVSTSEVRDRIRKQYGISDDVILIVTGGKINNNRPETLNLMKAVARYDNPHVKLLVFGNVSDNLKDDFDNTLKNSSIIYIGWIKSKDTYEFFSASDLVVFPGLHSVMWEQAVAQGKPCVFKKIKGFDHVDLGGNAQFLNDSSVDEIERVLKELIEHPEKINQMKKVAEEKGMETFSYLNIAKRSIKKEID